MTYLLFLLLLVFIVAGIILIVAHYSFRAPRIREKGSPADFDINYTKVAIPTIKDKKLFGWLLTVKESTQTIIILHGWGSNAELMLPLAIPFYHSGFNVLLIDARNHGNSDSGAISSMPRFAEDLGCSINWLKQHHLNKSKKIALMGHSVGAAAALLESSRRNDIDAVISLSSFAHPERMMKRELVRMHIPNFIVKLLFRYIESMIGFKLKQIAPMNTVCNIQCPVLLVHGKADTTVPLDDLHTIMKNCPKSHITLLEIEGAGHNSVDKIEQHYSSLAEFLTKSGFTIS